MDDEAASDSPVEGSGEVYEYEAALLVDDMTPGYCLPLMFKSSKVADISDLVALLLVDAAP